MLPAHKIDSKQHIDQLMFLSAIGVPQQSPDGSKFSDGKIGIWAMAERKPAQKSSKNRPAGTPEVKPVNVTADVFYDVMTRPDGVLDAVRKVNLDRVFMVSCSKLIVLCILPSLLFIYIQALFLSLHLLFVAHALDGGTDRFSHPWPRWRGV